MAVLLRLYLDLRRTAALRERAMVVVDAAGGRVAFDVEFLLHLLQARSWVWGLKG